MNLPFDRFNLKHCNRCLYPETKPNMVLEKDGVCTTCKSVDAYYNDTDWDAKYQDLKHLALEAKTQAKQRGCDYDVVVPVSGGKDSTFICWSMRALGLRVLGIFSHPMVITPRGQHNLETMAQDFPLLVYHTPQRHLDMPKKLWESFVTHGLPLQPYDDIIYGVPEKLAADMGIPLVMRGEDSEAFYGNRPEAAQQYQDHPTINDYLSHYIRWDSQDTAAFALTKGLEVRKPSELLGTGGYWWCEQLDDRFPIVSHHMKLPKYCYNRVSDHVARDLRAGRIPTEDHPVARRWETPAERDFAYREGKRLIWKYWNQVDWDEYIDAYCSYCGKTRAEWIEVAKGFDKFGVLG